MNEVTTEAQPRARSIYKCGRCRHCDVPIENHFDGAGWFHSDTGAASCDEPEVTQ